MPTVLVTFLRAGPSAGSKADSPLPEGSVGLSYLLDPDIAEQAQIIN